MADPTPGIYHDVPFESYLEWPYLSQSVIQAGRRSMQHLKLAIEQPHKPPTDAMLFGSLVHSCRIEPLAIAEYLAVMPEFEKDEDLSGYKSPKATRAYKDKVTAFAAENIGKWIATQEEYNQLLGIITSLSRHPKAVEYLSDEFPSEVSIVWEDPPTGLLLKGRLDKWYKAKCLIPDLKTTRDASRFDRSIVQYGYHIQAALYEDGMQILTGRRHRFAIVAVEKEPPYGVRVALLSEPTVQRGREIYQDILARYVGCHGTDIWTGYDDPVEWSIPEATRTEITLSGKQTEL